MRNNMTAFSSFFLRNVQCRGIEQTIFMCQNDGWKEDVGGGCNLPGYSVASVKCSGSGKSTVQQGWQLPELFYNYG